MADRKENISYTFTVEGDTEKWYLDWLEKQINACSDATYKYGVAFCGKQVKITTS